METPIFLSDQALLQFFSTSQDFRKGEGRRKQRREEKEKAQKGKKEKEKRGNYDRWVDNSSCNVSIACGNKSTHTQKRT